METESNRYTIRNGRKWEEKIHSGWWCSCYDIRQNGEEMRMVLKVSKDPGTLDITSPPVYLVDPKGNRLYD